MQVFQMYNSPMQPCFTPPRHHVGHGHFVGSPVHSQFVGSPMSPWQNCGVVSSPHQVVLAGAVQMSPTPTKQEPAERHFKYEQGDGMEKTARHPQGRYTIVRKLGSGVYGQVVECTDADGTRVAIKAVRAEHLYRECAKREIRALQAIGAHDNVCRILRNFDFQGHICIVQELIPGGTLYDKLKEFGGYSLYATQGIAKQLMCALAHIHKQDILHTDIKTDNIMIDGVGEGGIPLIKLVDLGSAIMRTDPHPDVIGTKEYRSPEAVLQAGWSSPADLWALGCSIFEALTGHRLFEFDHEITQLHMLERVLCCRIPADLLRRGAMKRNKFNAHLLASDSCSLARPVAAEAHKISAQRPLSEHVPHSALLSLLQQMLAVDPAARPSARSLLQHPFFSVDLEDRQPEVALPAEPASEGKPLLLPSSSSEDLSVCSTMGPDDKDASTRASSPAPASGSKANSAGSTVDVAACWAHLSLQDAPGEEDRAYLEGHDPVLTLPLPTTGELVEAVRC